MKARKPTKSSAASTRERLPSISTIIVSATEASRATGTSFLTVEGRMVIGATIAATPTMSMALKMFEPTTLPTARSAVPFSADTKLTQNSGADVPSATMVSPITICGISIRSARATAPSVRRSAPHKTSTTPATIIRMFTIIILF